MCRKQCHLGNGPVDQEVFSKVMYLVQGVSSHQHLAGRLALCHKTLIALCEVML